MPVPVQFFHRRHFVCFNDIWLFQQGIRHIFRHSFTALRRTLLPSRPLHRIRGRAVRPEAYSNDSTAYQRDSHDPPARLSVVQDFLHPLLYADLPEGKRTDTDQPPLLPTAYQRPRIVLSLIKAQSSDDLFIAGKLNVPAKQNIGEPADRLEPVHGQKQEAQWFPQLIPSFQMRLLMCEHMAHLRRIQPGGQIDMGSDKALDKRSFYGITKINIVPVTDSFPHSVTDTDAAHRRTAKHDEHPDAPDNSCRLRPGYAPHCIVRRRIDGRTLQNWTHDISHACYPIDRSVGCGAGDNHRMQNVCPWYQTDRTLKGKRTDQTDRHASPQHTPYPLWHSPKCRPEQYNCQNHPARRHAPVKQFQKNIPHAHSSRYAASCGKVFFTQTDHTI